MEAEHPGKPFETIALILKKMFSQLPPDTLELLRQRAAVDPTDWTARFEKGDLEEMVAAEAVENLIKEG